MPALALGTQHIYLNSESIHPLHKQLAQQLRQLIISGQLAPQERIPASRILAQQLKTSRTTVLTAFAQLQAEGYLFSQQGAGVFVAQPIMSMQANTKTIRPPNNNTKQLLRQQNTIPRRGFNAGPDAQAFPFSLWARCLAKAWRYPDPELLVANLPGGYEPLRIQIAIYLKRLRAIECDPVQVLITAGNRDSMAIITNLVCPDGGTLMLENPGYPLQTRVAQALKLNILYTPIDSQGALVPEFSPVTNTKGVPNMVVLTANRQYPLGKVMNGPRRHEWLHFAQQQQCLIIEDDYDSEYVYEGQRPATLFSMDNQQNVIFMGSFSKLMFQNFRLGYLVVPSRLIGQVRQISATLGNMASLHIQPALASFMADRHFASHMRRMSKLYQERRDALVGLVEEHLSPWLSVQSPSSGMHLVVTAKDPDKFDDITIENAALRNHIFCPALSPHYQRTPHTNDRTPKGFLLGFSGITLEQMEFNIHWLKSYLNCL